MNSTYEFTLKEGPKVNMENFWRTKSWRKILEGLKRKVGIFIGTKTYLIQKKIEICFNHKCMTLTTPVTLNKLVSYMNDLLQQLALKLLLTEYNLYN